MSYFSSGLSVVQYLTPPPSPIQLIRPDSPILPLTPACEVATDITDRNTNPSQAFGTDRPKLRKRRSSLTVNTSPLVQLKGSYRGATTATQRQSRSRSGSVNDFPQPCPVNFPIEEVKVVGRSRSGSVGNSLRSRRIIRGARPPPSTPLPPLPPFMAFPSPAPNLGPLDADPGITLLSSASGFPSINRNAQTSSAIPNELDTGPAFRPVVDIPEDSVMNEN